MSQALLGNLALDFAHRLLSSMNSIASSDRDVLEFNIAPIRDERLHTTFSSGFMSTKTNLGLDIIPYASCKTRLPYIDRLFSLSGVALGNIITPVFIELAAVIDDSTPFPFMISKNTKFPDKGPLTSLLRADKRFRHLFKMQEETISTMVKIEGVNSKYKWSIPLELAVAPLEDHSLIGARFVPNMKKRFGSWNITTLSSGFRVFDYMVPKPMIEIVSRIAYYIRYMRSRFTYEISDSCQFPFLIRNFLSSSLEVD